MAFNIRPFGKVLNNLMYGDKCKIERLGASEDEYGATDPNSRSIIYDEIKCKFSFTAVDNPSDSNEVYVPVLKEVRVFLDLDYDIKSGDLISGDRTDPESGVSQHIEGICGEPNRFDYHQEIHIIIDKES